MIHGIEGVQLTIGKLEASELTIYLTGSRFFDTQTPESDWDFFTENAELAEKVLAELGFEALEKYSGYAYDLNTEKIYRKVFKNGDQIDVQLAKNVQLRIDAQKLIKESGVALHKLKRNQRQRVWNLVYTALNYSGFYQVDQ